MRNFVSSVAVGCGVLACASVAFAQADPKTEQTPRFEEALVVKAPAKAVTGANPQAVDYYLTFNTPVGIPGVTLAAGTYLFRFPAGVGSDVIQVLKSDSSDVYSMFVATHVEDATRNLFSDGRIVVSRERPDAVPRITEWYLAGRSTGYEFLYAGKPE